MRCGQGWLIKNKNADYLLLINGKNYVGLSSALRTYHGPWYMIKITSLIGTEKEIVNSVNDKNRVSVTADWNDEKLLSFDIVIKNSIIFTGNEAMIIKETVYKK
jgi:hypothetical protein